MNFRDKVDAAFRAEEKDKSAAPPPGKAEAIRTRPNLAWEPFPLAVFPEPVRTFVSAGARAIGCDPSMIALPTLSACAAAIGTTRQVRLKQAWAEPCVIWTGVLARSGTLKSPALQYAMTPLYAAQLNQLRQYESAMQSYEADMIRYESDVGIWKRKPNSGEMPKKPTAPVCVRHVVSETTIEALAPIMLANPRGVLLARDELAAWLTGFNQYKPKGGSDAAAWLELHRAGTVIVDRKTGAQRTIFVPRAAVSVCGTIQPGTMQRLLTREFFEAGLPARLLLAAPPERQKTWTDADVSPEIVGSFAALIDQLLRLEHGIDDAGELTPVDSWLSPDAHSVWMEWYNVNAASLATEPDDDLCAVRAKIEGYAARLALVLHLIRSASDPTYPSAEIGVESMIEGIALARWFSREAKRIYGIWRESDEEREEGRLVELIRRKGNRITPRELCQFSREFRGSTDAAERALQLLVQTNKGCWVDDVHGGGPGRPGRYFELLGPSTVYENDESSG